MKVLTMVQMTVRPVDATLRMARTTTWALRASSAVVGSSRNSKLQRASAMRTQGSSGGDSGSSSNWGCKTVTTAAAAATATVSKWVGDWSQRIREQASSTSNMRHRPAAGGGGSSSSSTVCTRAESLSSTRTRINDSKHMKYIDVYFRGTEDDSKHGCRTCA